MLVHISGEYRGTCLFDAQSLDRLSSDALPLAAMIASYVFETKRRRSRLKGARLITSDQPTLWAFPNAADLAFVRNALS